MIVLRSTLFWIMASLLTIPYGFALAGLSLVPLKIRYAVVAGWRRSFMFLVRYVLGVRMVVRGLENVPDYPVIIFAKHQSAWETVALQEIFHPVVLVLKQELLRIPFFGWGLASLKMISIDRNSGKEALRQIVTQGRERLGVGLNIIIFPEGTRVAPGEYRRYKPGAAYLACKTGTQVLPLAHNAGEIWPRKALLVRSGTITVSIGPLIDTAGKREAEINHLAETWIEGEMRQLSPRFYPDAAPEAASPDAAPGR
ncbi:MAG: hypothetical protein RIR00_2134 [Pseudomonadota bacterium]